MPLTGCTTSLSSPAFARGQRPIRPMRAVVDDQKRRDRRGPMLVYVLRAREGLLLLICCTARLTTRCVHPVIRSIAATAREHWLAPRKDRRCASALRTQCGRSRAACTIECAEKLARSARSRAGDRSYHVRSSRQRPTRRGGDGRCCASQRRCPVTVWRFFFLGLFRSQRFACNGALYHTPK